MFSTACNLSTIGNSKINLVRNFNFIVYMDKQQERVQPTFVFPIPLLYLKITRKIKSHQISFLHLFNFHLNETDWNPTSNNALMVWQSNIITKCFIKFFKLICWKSVCRISIKYCLKRFSKPIQNTAFKT